ncbi:MAG: hypothetical protein E6R07_08370 [Nevskiaceae bacterium]|nr:MAG: hypothetical protein E6R07_08370 [Nevskiaceae bacterium]
MTGYSSCEAACGLVSNGGQAGASSPNQAILNGAQQMMPALQQGVHDFLYGNPEQEAAAKAAREAEARRRAEEEARRTDEIKARLLGQPIDGQVPNGLGLMGATSEPPLRLMSADQALGTPASLKDSRLADPEHPAAGARVVDCGATQQLYNRMSQGLVAQTEALRRTHTQILAARSERRKLDEEQRHTAISSAFDTASELASNLEQLKMLIDAAKIAATSKEGLEKLQQAQKRLDSVRQQITDGKNLLASGKFGSESLRQIIGDLKGTAADFYALLDGPAALEKSGKKLAAVAFGPAGAAAFEGATHGIEWGYQISKEGLNDADLANAESTYDALRYQMSAALEKMQDASDDLKEYCK